MPATASNSSGAEKTTRWTTRCSRGVGRGLHSRTVRVRAEWKTTLRGGPIGEAATPGSDGIAVKIKASASSGPEPASQL